MCRTFQISDTSGPYSQSNVTGRIFCMRNTAGYETTTGSAGLLQVLVLAFLPLGGIHKVSLKANGQLCKHQDPQGVAPHCQVGSQVCCGCSGREEVVSVRKVCCSLVDTDPVGHQRSLSGCYIVSLVIVSQIQCHLTSSNATWQWFNTCSDVCRWLYSFH